MMHADIEWYKQRWSLRRRDEWGKNYEERLVLLYLLGAFGEEVVACVARIGEETPLSPLSF
jgi:hypothetical protein